MIALRLFRIRRAIAPSLDLEGGRRAATASMGIRFSERLSRSARAAASCWPPPLGSPTAPSRGNWNSIATPLSCGAAGSNRKAWMACGKSRRRGTEAHRWSRKGRIHQRCDPAGEARRDDPVELPADGRQPGVSKSTIHSSRPASSSPIRPVRSYATKCRSETLNQSGLQSV